MSKFGIMSSQGAASTPLPETTRFNFTGLIANDFIVGAAAGKGFLLGFEGVTIGIWFFVADETQPDYSGSGVAGGDYVQVTVNSGESAAQCAAALLDELASVGYVDNGSSGAVTTVDAGTNGTQPDASDVDSGIAISVIQQGSA